MQSTLPRQARLIHIAMQSVIVRSRLLATRNCAPSVNATCQAAVLGCMHLHMMSLLWFNGVRATRGVVSVCDVIWGQWFHTSTNISLSACTYVGHNMQCVGRTQLSSRASMHMPA